VTGSTVGSGLAAVEPLALGDGRRSSAELIYDYLRGLILDGELAPDTIISQVELAGLLGVSRTPLREALARLGQEGLIESEPNRRSRVLGLDIADVEVVFASRVFYGPLALLQTVPRLTEEDLAALEAALEAMRSASLENDFPAWEAGLRRFHALLALYAAEPLRRQADLISLRAERYRKIYYRAMHRRSVVDPHDPQHEAILRACRRREPQLAAEELARHFASVAISLIAIVAPEHEPAVVRGALQLMTRGSGS
jgi:DNA-binding GntR family transcriptional regulator